MNIDWMLDLSRRYRSEQERFRKSRTVVKKDIKGLRKEYLLAFRMNSGNLQGEYEGGNISRSADINDLVITNALSKDNSEIYQEGFDFEVKESRNSMLKSVEEESRVTFSPANFKNRKHKISNNDSQFNYNRNQNPGSTLMNKSRLKEEKTGCQVDIFRATRSKITNEETDHLFLEEVAGSERLLEKSPKGFRLILKGNSSRNSPEMDRSNPQVLNSSKGLFLSRKKNGVDQRLGKVDLNKLNEGAFSEFQKKNNSTIMISLEKKPLFERAREPNYMISFNQTHNNLKELKNHQNASMSLNKERDRSRNDKSTIEYNYRFQSLLNIGIGPVSNFKMLFTAFVDENCHLRGAPPINEKEKWIKEFYHIVLHLSNILFTADNNFKIKLLSFCLSTILCYNIVVPKTNQEEEVLELIGSLKVEIEYYKQLAKNDTEKLDQAKKQFELLLNEVNHKIELHKKRTSNEALIEAISSVISNIRSAGKEVNDGIILENLDQIDNNREEAMSPKITIRNNSPKANILSNNPKVDPSPKTDIFYQDLRSRFIKKRTLTDELEDFKKDKPQENNNVQRSVRKKDCGVQTSFSSVNRMTQTTLSFTELNIDNFFINQADLIEAYEKVKFSRKLEELITNESTALNKVEVFQYLMSGDYILNDFNFMGSSRSRRVSKEFSLISSNYFEEIMKNRMLEEENIKLTATNNLLSTTIRGHIHALMVLDRKLANTIQKSRVTDLAHRYCTSTLLSQQNQSVKNRSDDKNVFSLFLRSLSSGNQILGPTQKIVIDQQSKTSFNLVYDFLNKRSSVYKSRISTDNTYQEPPIIESFYDYLVEIFDAKGYYDPSQIQKTILNLLQSQTCSKVMFVLLSLGAIENRPISIEMQNKYFSWLAFLDEKSVDGLNQVNFEKCRHYYSFQDYQSLLKDKLTNNIDASCSESLKKQLGSLAIQDRNNNMSGLVVDFDDFFIYSLSIFDKNNSGLVKHFTLIYSSLDFSDDGSGISLSYLSKFCRLFYSRKSDSMINNFFFNKLRFYFYFYSQRSGLKLEHFDLDGAGRSSSLVFEEEVENDVEPFFSDQKKIDEMGFLQLCLDMKLFMPEDLYSVFLCTDKDKLDQDAEMKKIEFEKKREVLIASIKDNPSLNNSTKAEYLTNIESMKQQDNPVRYIIRYRILMDQYHRLMHIDKLDIPILKNFNPSEVINSNNEVVKTIHQLLPSKNPRISKTIASIE